jgi:hypothetical protein
MNQAEFITAVSHVSPEAAKALETHIDGPDADIRLFRPSDILLQLFYWLDTKEGHAFWNNVYENLCGLEPEDNIQDKDDVDKAQARDEVDKIDNWVTNKQP